MEITSKFLVTVVTDQPDTLSKDENQIRSDDEVLACLMNAPDPDGGLSVAIRKAPDDDTDRDRSLQELGYLLVATGLVDNIRGAIGMWAASGIVNLERKAVEANNALGDILELIPD